MKALLRLVMYATLLFSLTGCVMAGPHGHHHDPHHDPHHDHAHHHQPMPSKNGHHHGR